MSAPRILMCPPDYYGIEYEINPWMNRRRQVNHDVAVEQWQQLRALLQKLGVQISLLQPVSGLPDLVFTANAAMIYRQQAVLANFAFPQRQPEQPVDAEWFRGYGFVVAYLPHQFDFEGAGDALFCGDTLFAGYQIRSHASGHQQIADIIRHRVIPLGLVDQYYYHLDTCFCPLGYEQAIYYPPAFDEYGVKALQAHVPELIPVQADEARRFACNAVVVGRTVETNVGCPQLQRELQTQGFHTCETPLSEFVKAGGSAKCLTLRLDGEDAAMWAHG